MNGSKTLNERVIWGGGWGGGVICILLIRVFVDVYFSLQLASFKHEEFEIVNQQNMTFIRGDPVQ